MDKQLQLEEFENYMRTQDMADNTIRAYLFAIRQYFQIYPELTYSDLQLYKLHLIEHYKPQTINLRIHALNCFLNYLEWPDSPIMQVRIQQKIYLDFVISQADYGYLKTRLLSDEDYLSYFLVRFMAATGARISEVICFTVEDVERGFKDIHSKGDKIRRMYVPAALQKDARGWLKAAGLRSGYIFLNPSGKQITPDGVRRRLKRVAARYCLDERVVYPHSFRHRFAKNFIESCGDISLLSDLLGHESIETTRIYLRRSSSEQRAIVNKVVDW